MSDLRECPYCGKKVAELITAKDLEECKHFEDDECPCFEYFEGNHCTLYTVVCDYQKGGCGATSGYFVDKDKAIRRWNARGESWRNGD